MDSPRIIRGTLVLAIAAATGCDVPDLGTSQQAVAVPGAVTLSGSGSGSGVGGGSGGGSGAGSGSGVGSGSGTGSGVGSGSDVGAGSGEIGSGSGSDLVARHCGDADDEVELKSEIALERSELEIARAHSLRHAGRIAELEADAQVNQASIARVPTKKKLTYQIAANSIAGMLELSAVKNLARGRVVKNTATPNTCMTATAGEVRLAVASGTGTVWRPPNLATINTSAMKLGAGMWLQTVNDDGVQKIPIVGVVVAITEAGAQMFKVDDIRQAMIDFGAVLDKAIAMEKAQKAKWDAEVATHEAKLAELQKKLDALKQRPGEEEAGEADHDEFEAVETETTDIEPFL